MIFSFETKEAEMITHWIVTGLATVLSQRSDLTDKQIKKLRAHDIFASLMKALYKQRKTFVNEARVLFRVGADKYLQNTKRNFPS